MIKKIDKISLVGMGFIFGFLTFFYINDVFKKDKPIETDVYHYTQPGYNEMGKTGAENVISAQGNKMQAMLGNLYFEKAVTVEVKKDTTSIFSIASQSNLPGFNNAPDTVYLHDTVVLFENRANLTLH